MWKYPNPETVIVPGFNVSRMPNRRTVYFQIEDRRHVHFAQLKDGIVTQYATQNTPS